MATYDKSFAALFYSCYEYYLQTRSSRVNPRRGFLFRTLAKKLTGILFSFADAHEELYAGWVADRDHPGYLILVDPPIILRVPYHLVPVFPTDEALSTVWRLSRRLRTTEDSVICVSGSNAMRKAMPLITDVDYCEYVIGYQKRTANNFIRKLAPLSDIICVLVRIGDKSWEHPRPTGRPNNETYYSKLKASRKEHSSCKFDYYCDLDGAGVMEATNLCLICDRKGYTASSGRTFAAQEAPLTASNWIPNHLNDVIEMGRYIDHLLREIATYRKSGNYSKCLKRCASLARVMFMRHLTEQIADLLDKSPNALTDAIEQDTRMLARLGEEGRQTVQALYDKLASQIAERHRAMANPAVPRSTVEAFRNDAERVIAEVAGYYGV